MDDSGSGDRGAHDRASVDPAADDLASDGGASAGLSSVIVAEARARRVDSDAALGRYRTRLNRQRALYYPVVGAIVVALVVVFVVAYLHGEAHNTRLTRVSRAPAALSLQAPEITQRVAWHTSDRAAVGAPLDGGTVVVYGTHTMRGVDARTGDETWSYYRSDRTVCEAFQVDGIAVAVYELAGNCDEITALDAGTGEREWTRTLDFNGLPVHGRPSFQLYAAQSTLLVTTSQEIYSIGIGSGETGGENHFTYHHFGCSINAAVLGSQGALISQTCAKPRCGELKFCGKGPQLLLRGSPYSDYDDDNTKNPNRIVWNDLGNTDVPVAAGSPIAAGSLVTGALQELADRDGKPYRSISIGVPGTAWRRASAIPSDDGDLVVHVPDTGAALGTTALFGGDPERPQWTSRSSGPATVSGGTVVSPVPAGVRLLDRDTGVAAHTYPLSPAPPTGSTVFRLGHGFLVTSPAGTTAFA